MLVLAAGMLLLLLCMLASVLFGIHNYDLRTVWEAYTSFDGSNDHLVITNARVPRALVGAAVGASLAVAGALMQVLSRNPLASPSVFGINAGAVLLLVLSISMFGSALTFGSMIWISFAGAALTALFVFVLGSRGGQGFTPVKLTLAGASIAAFASSVTSGIVIIDKSSLDQALFWMVGSIVDRKLEHLSIVTPYMLIGLVIALVLSGALNVMALGDDVSVGLGQRLMLTRILACVSIVLLAGAAVAVAGPIAFVGLIVPHLCRFITGNDHRWLLPYCAVGGALLLVGADVASRYMLMPKEVPVGVSTALLGVPFLIYVARRGKHE